MTPSGRPVEPWHFATVCHNPGTATTVITRHSRTVVKTRTSTLAEQHVLFKTHAVSTAPYYFPAKISRRGRRTHLRGLRVYNKASEWRDQQQHSSACTWYRYDEVTCAAQWQRGTRACGSMAYAWTRRLAIAELNVHNEGRSLRCAQDAAASILSSMPSIQRRYWQR